MGDHERRAPSSRSDAVQLRTLTGLRAGCGPAHVTAHRSILLSLM